VSTLLIEFTTIGARWADKNGIYSLALSLLRTIALAFAPVVMFLNAKTPPGFGYLVPGVRVNRIPCETRIQIRRFMHYLFDIIPSSRRAEWSRWNIDSAWSNFPCRDAFVDTESFPSACSRQLCQFPAILSLSHQRIRSLSLLARFIRRRVSISPNTERFTRIPFRDAPNCSPRSNESWPSYSSESRGVREQAAAAISSRRHIRPRIASRDRSCGWKCRHADEPDRASCVKNTRAMPGSYRDGIDPAMPRSAESGSRLRGSAQRALTYMSAMCTYLANNTLNIYIKAPISPS